MTNLKYDIGLIKQDAYDIGGIHVERYKAKNETRQPPIICVHGGCHASWAWREHALLYAYSGYEVHALNWRGRGGSSDIDVETLVKMSIVDVVDDIRQVADGLDSAPILVGHSMGALAAQRFASEYEIYALVLLTPVIPSNVGAAQIELPIDDMHKPWGPPPFGIARQIFFQGLDDTQAAHFCSLLVPESPLRVFEATRWTISIDADRIKVPTLIISGALDVLTPPDTGASLAALYDAEYILEPDFGHNVLLGDGAQRIARNVLQWVGRSAKGEN